MTNDSKMDGEGRTGGLATSGNRMGPIDTHRYPSLSPANKKTIHDNSGNENPTNFDSVGYTSPDKKTISQSYPMVDEGVLRCWGLRRYEVGGVEVIGWEVGMEPA